MARLYGRAGRLPAQNGGLRPHRAVGYLNGVEGYYSHGMGPYMDFHECTNNTDSGLNSHGRSSHFHATLFILYG